MLFRFHFVRLLAGFFLRFLHAKSVPFSRSLRFNGHFPGEPGLASVY